MTLYQLGRALCSGLFYPTFRVKVYGRENIPKDGGVLLCANHISNFDPVILGITAPRPIHYMAKEELFSVPVLKSLLKHLYAFPVKRGMSDRGALRKGLEILKEGHVLGLFPEGTRSKTGEVGKGLAGAGFFALRSDVPVVPCAIIGSYRPFQTIKVVYGKPIDFSEMRNNKASAAEVTDTIMDQIKKLVAEYR